MEKPQEGKEKILDIKGLLRKHFFEIQTGWEKDIFLCLYSAKFYTCYFLYTCINPFFIEFNFLYNYFIYKYYFNKLCILGKL